MNRLSSARVSLREPIRVLLILAAYLLVSYTAALNLPGLPGQWTFVLALLFPLPLSFYSLRFGSLRVRGDVRSLGEGTVVTAAVALALLALWGAKPGITGSTAHLPAAILAAVLIAISEELLFRGAILPVLARKFGFAWGIFFSALLFGALHLQSNQGAGLAAVLAGLALGGVYLRSGVGACIAFHAVFNILCGPIMGLSVGGIPWPGLLEPAVPYDPLNSWLVQVALLLLVLWWVPRSLINRPMPSESAMPA